MANALVKVVPLALPVVLEETCSVIGQLTRALGLPREVLASDEEIANVWDGLPRLLARIPREQLNVLHARMVVAVSTGLFDSAVNYAWNLAVMQLRDKVRGFGLPVVLQIVKKKFDEEDLLELKDVELLELCLSLNLITEDGHFFLDQSRDVRNNFSAAHPPMGGLDDHEFLAFLSRCTKYALGDDHNPKGVDMHAFLKEVKAKRFKSDQLAEWIDRFNATHEAQRNLLITTLHGMYCDPAATQETRLNALALCKHFAEEFSAKLTADLLNQHSEYIASGKEDRQEASRQFFTSLGIVGLLGSSERHALITRACKSLRNVHDAWDNFYNEPPFAERLHELSEQVAVPESAQLDFVYTVALCGTGRTTGISRAALPDYHAMVRNFSPREIHYLLRLPAGKTTLATRISIKAGCRERFKNLVRLLDEDSVPTQDQKLYQKWVK
jgi:hypothetical protein